MKLLNKYEWHSSDESDSELDTYSVRQTEECDSDASNSVSDHTSKFIEEKRSGLGSSFKFVCHDKKCKIINFLFRPWCQGKRKRFEGKWFDQPLCESSPSTLNATICMRP